MSESSPSSLAPAVGEDTAPIPVIRPGRWRWVPITAACLLTGLLCGMPHWLMASRLASQGKTYVPQVVRGVTALTFDETTYYAPRVREVLDGHLFSADPDGLEHKKGTPFLGQAWLDSLIAGLLGFLVKRSVANVFILCDFLLPPLSVLLIYAVCRRLGAQEAVAIAAALVCVLAHDQVTLPFALAAHPSFATLADRLHLLSSDRPVEFTRLTVPQLAFIPLAATLLGLFTLYEHPRWRTAAWTGIVFAATIYCYAFYWTFALVGGLLLVGVTALRRDARRSTSFLLAALGLGLVIGLPVLYQSVAPHGFSGKAEMMARQSWGGRHVRWGYQKYDLALLVLPVVLYPKRRREFLPLLAFLLAPFACILGARAAGMNTQEWHWLGRCWQPWSAVATVLLLGAWIPPVTRRLWHSEDPLVMARRGYQVTCVAFGLLSLLTLAYTAQDHRLYAARMASAHTLPTGTQKALHELSLRAPVDSVLMALDPDALALAPVYTGCNVFLPYCIVTPATAAELLDRTAITFAAYGLSERSMSRLLSGPSEKTGDSAADCGLPNWLFHQTLAEGGIPGEAESIVLATSRGLRKASPAKLSDKYRVDLLWWGPYERALADPGQERKLARYLFIDAGDVKVYRLRTPKH